MRHQPPALGVGAVYSSRLDPLLDADREVVDLLELEPQTLWAPRDPDDPTELRVDEPTLERLRAWGLPVLVHGVGNPVGGTVRPEPRQAELFARVAEALDAPWVSEHLSFNRACCADGTLFAGFLLPPLPAPGGVAEAAASVRALAGAVGRPLAVETGVNYLRRRPGELTEGQFVGAVAEEAGCGILLDLHNLWVNERNGRQPIVDFLAEIPLDRVWEIHLAGGSERDGLWLDSHNGGVPGPLLELTRAVLPEMPNLGAIVFELLPANLPGLGLDGVRGQLGTLRELWEGRDRVVSGWAPPPPAPDLPLRAGQVGWPDGTPDPASWERALARAVLRRPAATPLEASLAGEPGVAVVADLVGEFRAAMVRRNLKLTARLLLLTVGASAFQRLLDDYRVEAEPALYAASEAAGFAAFLEGRDLAVAFLPDVLAFERATLATLLDDRPRVVPFRHDPLVLLRALAAGRLPADCKAGTFEVELTPGEVPEGWTLEDAAGSATWHH